MWLGIAWTFLLQSHRLANTKGTAGKTALLELSQERDEAFRQRAQ